MAHIRVWVHEGQAMYWSWSQERWKWEISSYIAQGPLCPPRPLKVARAPATAKGVQAVALLRALFQ